MPRARVPTNPEQVATLREALGMTSEDALVDSRSDRPWPSLRVPAD
jgi:hypothetical protein